MNAAVHRNENARDDFSPAEAVNLEHSFNAGMHASDTKMVIHGVPSRIAHTTIGTPTIPTIIRCINFQLSDSMVPNRLLRLLYAEKAKSKSPGRKSGHRIGVKNSSL